MNFAMKRIYIKSNWFDVGINKYKKIKDDGFNLYLNLFKFRIYNQEQDYMFITSISLLRKETGYSTRKIYELIRLLDKNSVISTNITRWERMIDVKGNIVDDKVLVITAIDKPNTNRELDANGKEKDFPVTDQDYYISLDLSLMDYYLKIGLNEKYFGLHCLLKKLSNNTEGKSWMGINKMAEVLGVGDKTLNNMIYELNRNYLLASFYRKSNKKRVVNSKKINGKSFEHHILFNLKFKDEWIKVNKEQIDKNIQKWDKRRNTVKAGKIMEFTIESELESENDDIPEENYLFEDELEE
jgi:DNA-binding transcriptional MerR regulator